MFRLIKFSMHCELSCSKLSENETLTIIGFSNLQNVEMVSDKERLHNDIQQTIFSHSENAQIYISSVKHYVYTVISFKEYFLNRRSWSTTVSAHIAGHPQTHCEGVYR